MKYLNITASNTDPSNTWKSAFRECAKLSKIINNQNEEETNERLQTWTTWDTIDSMANTFKALSSVWSLVRGSDPPLINDFNWLKENLMETHEILDRLELIYPDVIYS